MADEDDIKPDAPDAPVEGEGAADAPADAAPSLPQESEESGLAEDAAESVEDASSAVVEESATAASPDEVEADLDGIDSAAEQAAGTDTEAEDTTSSEEAEAQPTEVDTESGDEEELVEANLPPPGPPLPEEPKDDCPKCPGGGAPAWMATFADMATLLMAFFVLLLSFAETEVPKFKQVAGSLKMAFGIEKIVPKVTIPMARSIMVENFTPAVAERSVMDVKEQQSDFVRGDFIEKKTEEGEYEDPLDSDFSRCKRRWKKS